MILPTYDERATIEQVLKGVLAAPSDVDILVVDDSSPDGTADGRARPWRRPSPHPAAWSARGGPGSPSAYLEGFRLALGEGYDLVVEMDSDLSHDPTELPALLEAAAPDRDLVVGSRYVPGGSVTNWSRVRVALSTGGQPVRAPHAGLPLHDATSGYRVYRAELLEDLMAEPDRREATGSRSSS